MKNFKPFAGVFSVVFSGLLFVATANALPKQGTGPSINDSGSKKANNSGSSTATVSCATAALPASCITLWEKSSNSVASCGYPAVANESSCAQYMNCQKARIQQVCSAPAQQNSRVQSVPASANVIAAPAAAQRTVQPAVTPLPLPRRR